MFTDMVGYTALGQRNESLSLALVEEQRKLIRPILKRHRGREVKTMGDAFLVEFPSALDAVRCAYDIQRAAREFNISQPEERRVHLRVGIHIGDVVESDHDISGDAVNVASRVELLAEDGGVCLTRQVYDHVQNKFELPMKNLGTKSLKNVSHPQEVYKLVLPWDEGKSQQDPLDRNRIAVLPFTNMSPDPNDEYFADGLTEEMITELSRINSLRVIGRTSAMVYKNAKKSLREIATELKVGSLLEGSIRKAGNRLRITAQLVDAGTEEHLWADKFDRETGDIFAIQTEIATNIAQVLQLKLGDRQRIRSPQEENLQAFTLYLRGRFLWNQRNESSIREALKLFEKIVDKYPDYAKAYSGIADCYLVLPDFSETPLSEALPKSRAAAEKAVDLDDTLPEAHASLGLQSELDMDDERAEKEFKRAIELNPSYATAHHWYGVMLGESGRLLDARKEFAEAEEADPLSSIILFSSGYLSWVIGRDEEALEKWNRGLEANPGLQELHAIKATYYSWKKMRTEAMAELEQIHSLPEKDRAVLSGVVHAWFGERRDAELCLQNLLSATERVEGDTNKIAWLYASIGDVDKFYEYAMKAIFVPGSLFSLSQNPLLEKMRKDPRYLELQKKLKVQVG